MQEKKQSSVYVYIELLISLVGWIGFIILYFILTNKSKNFFSNSFDNLNKQDIIELFKTNLISLKNVLKIFIVFYLYVFFLLFRILKLTRVRKAAAS